MLERPTVPLADDEIAAIVRRAEAVACARSPRPERCWALPASPAQVARSLTPDGWAEVGRVSDVKGRRAWIVWWNARTGKGRLRRTATPRFE